MHAACVCYVCVHGVLGIEPPAYTPMASFGRATQASSTANVNVDTSPRPEEEEFDMFAASRQAGFTAPNKYVCMYVYVFCVFCVSGFLLYICEHL